MKIGCMCVSFFYLFCFFKKKKKLEIVGCACGCGCGCESESIIMECDGGKLLVGFLATQAKKNKESKVLVVYLGLFLVLLYTWTK